MDPITQQTALACAGASGGAAEALYVDDVFSTFLYDGTGASSNSIDNGIDLDGEGGLVWGKVRNSGAGTSEHYLFDTERGVNKYLLSTSNDAEASSTNVLTSFNSDGFTVGGTSGNYDALNSSTGNFVSWTFRKAPGFFDVVTYTGNGSSTGDSQTLSHNLGSTPGFVIIKRTSGTGDWVCWHRSISTGQPRKYIELDSTNGTGTMGADIWGTVSSTEFEVKHNGTTGDSYEINKNGETYVAYFFAHDDQSFGTNGDEAIIKCGSVTTSSSGTASIDLDFEAQWVLLKRTGGALDWYLWDTMRGIATGGDDQYLRPNISDAEGSANNIAVTPTGFDLESALASENWIYMAIRRPHKPPTDGDDVFKPFAHTSSGTTKRTTGFPVDLQILAGRTSGFTGNYWFDRLRGFSTNDTAGGTYLQSHSTNSESTTSDYPTYHDNTGFKDSSWLNNVSVAYWNFKRAPGFFDVVAYTGNGSSQTLSHNLEATPELMLVKERSATGGWEVYTSDGGNTKFLELNGSGTYSTNQFSWNNTSPTSTQFTVGANNSASGTTYIAYLFATLDGISKVGTYSGTGNNVDVDCGFSAGARFVLIKRTDGDGGWFVWDTTRGIVSGNDPNLRLDTTDAESTNDDYIDPLNSGFTVTSAAPATLNTSGGTYLFLAIA